MKEIFGDNKIMYQFSEAIDTGVRRVFPLMDGSDGSDGSVLFIILTHTRAGTFILR